MKKRTIKVIMSYALILVMILAMSAAAFADGFIPSYTVRFTKNLDANVSCTYGQSVTLSVAATVDGATNGEVSYTWCVVGDTTAAAGTSFTITPTQNRTVYCVASGYVDGVKVAEATSIYCNVTVNAAATPVPTTNPSAALSAPTITGQPGSINLAAGQTATLSVSATCPNLGNGVTLYYQWFKSSSANGANYTQINGANASTYSPPAATSGTTYYFVGIKAYNGAQYSSAVYSNVIYVSYDGSGTVMNGGPLKITKNPTGETVNVGGSATFIARADNAYSRVWRIVSKDTTKTVNAKNASSYFSGLTVSGADTDTLVLSNIPASMHEWSVECKFIAADGKTFLCTNGAIIRVNGASSSTTSTPAATAKPQATYNPSSTANPTTSPSASTIPNTGDTSSAVSLSAPTISSQPVSAVLSEGETTTLSVVAAPAVNDGSATLHYQWYRNDTNSNANGTKIAGAESATYVPDTISGSKYYYVGVWSSSGTTSSKVIYSSPVTVTYTAPITSSGNDKDDDAADKDESPLKGIAGPMIAMVLAAVAIGVGVFFLLKNISGKKTASARNNYYDDDDYDDDDE